MSASAALTLEQGVAQLAAMVGEEHTRLRGETGQTIEVAPGDMQQVAEILRFAHANALSVMPVGAGTKLSWGNTFIADIELSMKRLNQLREHAWQDMTCTVQAGCSWMAMQEALSTHGQMVALDSLHPERATVGGIVACNDSGALRLKYGGLRDLVIGMSIVLADGTIAKSGGKVVKNVAGYDMHKLLTGSFGTLGVIGEVNFRLHPLEEHRRTWTAVATSAAASSFAEPLRALLDAQLTPSSVQLRVSRGECALDIRIASPPECLDDYEKRIGTILGTLAIRKSGEEVWNAREQLFDDNDALVLKVSVLPTEICPLAAELHQWTAGDGTDLELVAQATGLMMVAVHSATVAALVALIERLRARVSKSGGSVVALQIRSRLRSDIDVWGPDRGTFPLMREIKRRFDPGRILNPGRFVGNI
jgi:glycolate dehydrogenase FAD-binding subunit